jgi:hypothetical protein
VLIFASRGLEIGAEMSEFFVAGGSYQNLKGEERFDLLCPGPGEPPYVMVDSVMDYFRLLWQNAHLYRVEENYALSLVAPSPEALQWGVRAPEKVLPDANLLKKLQAACPYPPQSKVTNVSHRSKYQRDEGPVSQV